MTIETRETLEALQVKIERLEGFDEPTGAQERQLESLRAAFAKIDEARKEQARQALADRLAAGELTVESGHTPERDLDDE